jgi:glyoxylate/hydroxypyruvate reductase A
MTDMAAGLPVLLVRSGGVASVPEWQALFAELGVAAVVQGWDDPTVDPARVRYVLVWEPEIGRLATYPNLQVIFSSAAGVDHITRDPHLPRHVPIVSMGAEEVAQTVGEYVCLGALTILRDLPRIMAAQRAAKWDAFESGRTACGTRVGIMGMGRIGLRTARMLEGIGFAVHGWTRTPRPGDGPASFTGAAELDDFLARSDIVVGILPDTPQTRGLMNAERIGKLPRGAGLISVGRGTFTVMPDVIAALDAGQLSLAVLDVFETEPLPPEDPAWRHPRIVVSPHVAGGASRRSRAEAVAAGLRQHAAGERIDKTYDPERGY